MGATPVCQITAAGIVRPTFEACLSYVQTSYRAIYGQDINIEPATQDGQFLTFLANAIHDANGETVAAFNSFSPGGAQGTGLDRNVKINGLRRKRWTYSTAPFRVVGQAGVVITGGTVTDAAGNAWALPAVVRIPDAGEITVTATCQTKGAVPLPAGALDTDLGQGAIANVTRGWQSVNNVAAASPGQPVETDSALRQRQAISTALPSLSINDGLLGALYAVSGVTRAKVYENDEGYPTDDGIPGHCLAAVVDGGDAATIAALIRLKKGSAGTYGSTLVMVDDTGGVTKPIRFTYLTQPAVAFAIVIQKLPGYTLSIENQWKASLAAFVNGLDIGETVERDQAFAAAKLYDGVGSKTYRIVSFQMARLGFTPVADDVAMTRFEAATCDVANITSSVVS